SDCFYGEGGVTTASFATAPPPGPSPQVTGVDVDLTAPAQGRCPIRGTGHADGDGTEGPEAMSGIQFVVGSAFDDVIHGQPGVGVDAGLGADSCSGFDPGEMTGCGGGDEGPASTFSYVFNPSTPAPPDPGLIIRGRPPDAT